MVELSFEFASLLPDFALKIAAALLCGIILGLEREYKDKPAGLRTIVLITVGSTIFMIVSGLIPLITKGPTEITRADPTRIASQVVTGIGFLGAGTIIQTRGAVHGLTTAAVIWVGAGLGLCVGAGFPLFAVGLAIAIVLALSLLHPLGTWINRRHHQTLALRLPDDSLALSHLNAILSEHDVRLDDLSLTHHSDGEVQVHIPHQLRHNALLRLLTDIKHIDGVRGVPTS